MIKMTKIFIKTFGCQANISDSEQIAGLLKKENYNIVEDESEADTIIVNSCSVKNKTQSKIFHYIKSQLEKDVFVGGCLTKTINLRKKFPKIKAIFDTNSILKVPEILKNPKDVFSSKKEDKISTPLIRKNNEIGIIQISTGCLNACTFCATKLARGNLKSYKIGDIKRAFQKAIGDGCKKIYLTSQDNGCYGFDIKTSLPELLDELVTVKGNYKVRVGMINPWHLKKILTQLVESYKSEKIQKFLHLPVQSGSEKILKEMKRIHTVENFKEAVEKFRETFKNITITTDIIVGFPTETEQDFQETYNLIKEIKPEVLNISKFSSRPNTTASKIKQLPSEVIKERSVKLDKLYKSYRKIKKQIPKNDQ